MLLIPKIKIGTMIVTGIRITAVTILGAGIITGEGLIMILSGGPLIILVGM